MNRFQNPLFKIHMSIKTVDEKVLAESEDNTSSDLINFEEVLYQQKNSIENFAESETKYNKEYLITNILLAGAVLSSIGFITSKLLP